MATISVGEVELAGGKYEVVLKRVGAATGNPSTTAPVGNAPGAGAGVGGGKKTRKEKKAKGTRKSGLTGYMKFAGEVRPRIMKENPGMSIPDMGRKIGAEWRALSDAEKAKY